MSEVSRLGPIADTIRKVGKEKRKNKPIAMAVCVLCNEKGHQFHTCENNKKK